MAAPNLLIADSSRDFTCALAESLQNRYHVHCCGDGKDAIHLLLTTRPEILVLDLMLPGLDGISLLQIAAQEGICPKVLASTTLYSDYIVQTAQELGVGYLLRKPCDVQATVMRIDDLHHRLHARTTAADSHNQLGDLLQSLSMLAKHNGYHYVRECIVLAAQNPGQSVTKELYPAVAEIFGTEAPHVEHSIRTALSYGWKHRNSEVWEEYFPAATRCPSNGVFIARMAELMR